MSKQRARSLHIADGRENVVPVATQAKDERSTDQACGAENQSSHTSLESVDLVVLSIENALGIDYLVTVDDLVTTQEAAVIAGVGTSTVKRWADDGLLECVKTPGGHRRYRRASLLALLGSKSQLDEWFELFESSSDYGLVAKLLALRGQLGTWARVADALGPVVEELGARWQRGELTIIQEHSASDRLLRAVRKVIDTLPLAPSAPRALLACAQGDEHTLGLALCELVLHEAGFATLWSGRDTPNKELVSRVRLGDVRVVALSASVVSDDASSLAEQAAALERVCAEHDCWLFVGGRGAWPTGNGRLLRPSSFVAFREALLKPGVAA